MSAICSLVLAFSPELSREAMANGGNDYERGRQCFTSGDYACALSKYNQAVQGAPAETKARVYLAIAQTLLQLGRPLDARVALGRAAEAVPNAELHPGALTASEKKRIHDALEYLDSVLAQLVVTTGRVGIPISIDGGAPVPSLLPGPIYLLPGTHEVEAGFREPVKRLVRLNEGELVPLELEPEQEKQRVTAQRANTDQAPNESLQSQLNASADKACADTTAHEQTPPSMLGPYVAAGVSVLGLGFGLGFVIAANEDYDAATHLGCSKTACPTGQSARLNQRALIRGNVATAAFGVSLVAAATSTLWWHFNAKRVQLGVSTGFHDAGASLRLAGSW